MPWPCNATLALHKQYTPQDNPLLHSSHHCTALLLLQLRLLSHHCPLLAVQQLTALASTCAAWKVQLPLRPQQRQQQQPPPLPPPQRLPRPLGSPALAACSRVCSRMPLGPPPALATWVLRVQLPARLCCN